MTKNFFRVLAGLLLVLILITATFFAWFYSRVDASLPQLNGQLTIYGLKDSVTLERDKIGVATISGNNREDIAFATGFLHAQERFFQMDLLRRNAAGELSSLFGEAAIAYDSSVRVHRFRERARRIMQHLPPRHLSMLDAYTQGVNSGLARLNAKPFEYFLLQTEPVKWRDEDSLLTVFSMYLDLQYADGKMERSLGVMKSKLSKQEFNFFYPQTSNWDSALDNSTLPLPPMPTSFSIGDTANNTTYEFEENILGSSSWAVAPNHSASGRAILANDMHLTLRVPNIWFRAQFNYLDKGKPVKVTGVTLPGAPSIIVGSNGNIAWGFTNSYGDWSDLIKLELSENKRQYKTPDGFKNIQKFKEMVAVKEGSSKTVTVQETEWGPIIGEDHQGNLLAYRWVAHDTNAVNFRLADLETADNIEQAINIAALSGVPAQNFLVVDRNGGIAWTIMGPMPIRSGTFGQTPTSWADGKNHWQGYYAPSQYPVIKNPPTGRLWTANARNVGGEMLNKIGNGGYALGARGKQIADNLSNLPKATEEDLFKLGLDDNALFLSRWHKLVLSIIEKEQAFKSAEFNLAKTLLNQPSLAATVDSHAYLIVKTFRRHVIKRLYANNVSQFKAIDPSFDFRSVSRFIEYPTWQLITKQPKNFPLTDGSWSTLLTESLKITLTSLIEDHGSLENATWGSANASNIAHPLSKAVPMLSYLLDMPKKPLAGDKYMPRIQGPSFGASERLVVSPGHEEDGIFNMPSGQSGHPWSPFYDTSHNAWVQGKPTPFLPGETVYKLQLNAY